MKLFKNSILAFVLVAVTFTSISCDKNKDDLQRKDELLLGDWKVVTVENNTKSTIEYTDTSIKNSIKNTSYIFKEFTNDRLTFFPNSIKDELLIKRFDTDTEPYRGPFNSEKWNVEDEKLISDTTREESYTLTSDNYSYNGKTHVIIKELTRDKLILEHIVHAIHSYEQRDFNKIIENRTTIYTYTK